MRWVGPTDGRQLAVSLLEVDALIDCASPYQVEDMSQCY